MTKYNYITILHTSYLWAYYWDGSQWFHTDAVIFLMPKINTHFVKTFMTPKGDFPITVSPSINGSAWLVSMNECFFQTRSSYHELSIPYSYNRQRDMFHPSVVGFFQVIHR